MRGAFGASWCPILVPVLPTLWRPRWGKAQNAVTSDEVYGADNSVRQFSNDGE
jgi:hypothetical protein